MKISRKAYYGLRAMTRLARENEPISVRTLAQEEGLPEEFLEKIFQNLRKAGLLSAIKGASGGYALALNPEEITAGHILTALDGTLIPFPCVDNSSGGCPIESQCATQDVWKRLSTAIQDTLDGITLKNLIR